MFGGGSSHNSVAIEMRDHLVPVETPLNDAHTQSVIAQARTLAVARKPVGDEGDRTQTESDRVIILWRPSCPLQTASTTSLWSKKQRP